MTLLGHFLLYLVSIIQRGYEGFYLVLFCLVLSCFTLFLLEPCSFLNQGPERGSEWRGVLGWGDSERSLEMEKRLGHIV